MNPGSNPPIPWGQAALLLGLALLALRLGSVLWRAPARRRPGPGAGRRFLIGEERASALFDFVLTFPLFLMIVLVVVQMALMINARLVVGWAAFAAARSAVVHTDGGVEAALAQAEEAAALACLPIASRSALPRLPDPALLPILAAGNENPRLPGSQLQRRWRRATEKLAGARRTTEVEIRGADRDGRFAPRAPVTVTVTHHYRLAVPWAGGALARLVGERRWNGPAVAISETAVLIDQGRIETGGELGDPCVDPLGSLFDLVFGTLRRFLR